MIYTSAEIIQIITAITTLVGVVGGIMISIRNGTKTTTAINEIRQNTVATEEIRSSTNGMSVQLMEVTKAAGIAEGKIQGIAAEIKAEGHREEGRAEERLGRV